MMAGHEICALFAKQFGVRSGIRFPNSGGYMGPARSVAAWLSLVLNMMAMNDEYQCQAAFYLTMLSNPEIAVLDYNSLVFRIIGPSATPPDELWSPSDKTCRFQQLPRSGR